MQAVGLSNSLLYRCGWRCTTLKAGRSTDLKQFTLALEPAAWSGGCYPVLHRCVDSVVPTFSRILAAVPVESALIQAQCSIYSIRSVRMEKPVAQDTNGSSSHNGSEEDAREVHLRALFGDELLSKVRSARVLVVGAGGSTLLPYVLARFRLLLHRQVARDGLTPS